MENQTFHLSCEQDPGLAILTIDQPNSKANVFSRALLGELSDTIKQLESHRNINGLICRSGKPGMFIAGADLKELGDGIIAGDRAVDFAKEGQGILARLERLPYPTVCIVEGPALGGGMEFALCFDARLAVDHPKTQLGLPETKLGLIPGWGGTQRLPRLVGLERGLQMMLSGEGTNAQAAAGWVDRVCPSDMALQEAKKLTATLHTGVEWQKRRDKRYGPMIAAEEHQQALQTISTFQAGLAGVSDGTKHAKEVLVKLVTRTLNTDLLTGLEEEARAFAQVAGTPQSKELIAAFFAARAKPKD